MKILVIFLSGKLIFENIFSIEILHFNGEIVQIE